MDREEFRARAAIEAMAACLHDTNGDSRLSYSATVAMQAAYALTSAYYGAEDTPSIRPVPIGTDVAALKASHDRLLALCKQLGSRIDPDSYTGALMPELRDVNAKETAARIVCEAHAKWATSGDDATFGQLYDAVAHALIDAGFVLPEPRVDIAEEMARTLLAEAGASGHDPGPGTRAAAAYVLRRLCEAEIAGVRARCAQANYGNQCHGLACEKDENKRNECCGGLQRAIYAKYQQPIPKE